MTDRERLIELLKNAPQDVLPMCLNLIDFDCRGIVCNDCYGKFADYLLSNGIIVPPIKKVGEKLYFHQFDNEFKKVVVEGEIIKIANGEREYVVKLKDGRKLTFLISFFGKTVFLTKEEAEQALKEREQV